MRVREFEMTGGHHHSERSVMDSYNKIWCDHIPGSLNTDSVFTLIHLVLYGSFTFILVWSLEINL